MLAIFLTFLALFAAGAVYGCVKENDISILNAFKNLGDKQ